MTAGLVTCPRWTSGPADVLAVTLSECPDPTLPFSLGFFLRLPKAQVHPCCVLRGVSLPGSTGPGTLQPPVCPREWQRGPEGSCSFFAFAYPQRGPLTPRARPCLGSRPHGHAVPGTAPAGESGPRPLRSHLSSQRSRESLSSSFQRGTRKLLVRNPDAFQRILPRLGKVTSKQKGQWETRLEGAFTLFKCRVNSPCRHR